MRIVLVDVSIANHGDTAADARYLYLTSAKFKAPAQGGPAIVYPADAALQAIYGVPDDKAPFKTLPEGWDAIEPGESRTLTLPFIVYRNELVGRRLRAAHLPLRSADGVHNAAALEKPPRGSSFHAPHHGLKPAEVAAAMLIPCIASLGRLQYVQRTTI